MTNRFCPECGKPVTPDAHFCAECGHVLAEPDVASAEPVLPPPPVAADHVLPPPPPPTESSRPKPTGDRGRRALIGVIVVLVLALVSGAIAAAVLLSGDDKETKAAADETDVVVLEPAALEVPDPFTDSVAVAEQPILPGPEPSADATAPPEVATGAGGGVVRGSAPGLYGGTQDQQSCDPARMVEFLEDDPDKARAWAEVQDIEVEEIREFVAGLTPVVLRRDTRVVNHGYQDGKANAYAAVLQAGTAVLVDEFGVPRAKCSCGNPLAPARPVTTATRYEGRKWTGFEPDRVVVVKVDVRISVVVLVDPDGEPFGRPVGTTGAEDTDASSGATDGASGSSEGTTAPVLDEIGSLVAVSNGPTAPSVLTLPAARVTAIRTYHWNNAQGETPGTITLRGEDGAVYGPFRTTGSLGQGGVPNAYWTAVTDFLVPAGSYTVTDSSPGTWAWAPDTGGRGMVTVWGIAEVGTTGPEAVDRRAEAKQAITSRYCGGFSEYVTWVRARETDTELYRVEVHIELDSGEWTAAFDVDFATEFGPEIRPLNDESADLLCN
jgi:hypothetical protein